jgi:hypothetical protein
MHAALKSELTDQSFGHARSLVASYEKLERVPIRGKPHGNKEAPVDTRPDPALFVQHTRFESV